MTLKTKILALCLAFAFISILAVDAFAAEAWYTCNITRVGGYTATNGAINVRLSATNGAFSNVYFRIPEGRLNQIMAVVLTAASNGSTVYARVDPVAKTLSQIYYNVD